MALGCEAGPRRADRYLKYMSRIAAHFAYSHWKEDEQNSSFVRFRTQGNRLSGMGCGPTDRLAIQTERTAGGHKATRCFRASKVSAPTKWRSLRRSVRDVKPRLDNGFNRNETFCPDWCKIPGIRLRPLCGRHRAAGTSAASGLDRAPAHAQARSTQVRCGSLPTAFRMV
jgi:hypothetical protein